MSFLSKYAQGKWVSAFVLLGLLVLSGHTFLFGAGVVHSTLYSELEVNRLGLTRPWFNQVQLDYGKSQVTSVTLQDDVLFITTDAGRLHAIDGKTGTTLWSRLLGSSELLTSEAAVNSKIVAIIHGTNLIVLDRFDGRRLLDIPIQAPPGAGPQVSERYIYVPILTGKIFAYPITPIPSSPGPSGRFTYEDVDALRANDKLSATVREKMAILLGDPQVEKYAISPVLPHEILMCPALGRPLVQPLLATQTLTDDYCSWVTDAGSLLLARTHFSDGENALKLAYRVTLSPELFYADRGHLPSPEKIAEGASTDGPRHFKRVFVPYDNEMNYRPTYCPFDKSDFNSRKTPSGRGGMLLVGAQTGYVFAVNDFSGDVDWEFCAGERVIDPIGLSVDPDNTSAACCYATTYLGNFFCVKLKDGSEVWRTERVRQFVAATPSRIYVHDIYGNLVALDKETGKEVARISMDMGTYAVFNVESDRIYMVAPDGLVQCLHEIDSDQPRRYRESAVEIGARLEAERAAFLLKKSEEKSGEKGNDGADEEAGAAGAKPVNAPLISEGKLEKSSPAKNDTKDKKSVVAPDNDSDTGDGDAEDAEGTDDEEDPFS